jgi:acetyl esterase
MTDPDPTMLSVTAALPPIYTLSLEEARGGYQQYLAIDQEIASVASVRDEAVPGPEGDVPVRIYEPHGDGPHPTLLWFHGGGFVLGDVDGYDDVCRVLCAELDAVVVSVDYRLAPEHPFPAGLTDCYGATVWAAEHVDALGGDPDRLIVGGDSAGGNLAAAVALLARDREGPAIDYQVLVYPTTTFQYEFDTDGDVNEDLFLTPPDLEWSWDLYLEHDVEGMNPYASPLQARSLADLPPATVITCSHDPLEAEGVAYADRLADAGVPVRHEHYDEMIHSFFTLLAEPRIDQAWEAVDRIRSDLDAAVGL